MIYFCADDYGLCESASEHIRQGICDGVLNKVSVFPNFDPVDLTRLLQQKSIRLSLHLNLVEGRCMARAEEIPLLADQRGNFRHTFGGLFRMHLLHKKELEAQLYQEIRAQVLFWKNSLPKGTPFCVDSHQHTHMIPSVFRALLRVIKEENIQVEYLRIPAEPVLPYLKEPSLYVTYRPVNLVKQWLLKGLWLQNQRNLKQQNISTAYFMGILFSGRMDEKRVKRILPHYQRLAEKKGRDVEVLFHPGYLTENQIPGKKQNVVFREFYGSQNRKTEFDSVMNLLERSV